VRRCAAQQLVGGDAQRVGERRDVVEREPPLARLQAAERRDVDVRPIGNLLQREPQLGP
jgi:hypothetical protein